MTTTVHATFSRFNVWHNGHQALLNRMVNTTQANREHLVIGFSNSARNRELSLRVSEFQDFNPANQLLEEGMIVSGRDMFSFIQLLSQSYDEVIFYVGADRANSAIQIANNYFDNVSVMVVQTYSSNMVYTIAQEAECFEEFYEICQATSLFDTRQQAEQAYLNLT